jgi:tRNA U34 5-methylaminomethyl-2-thiouridine-forming methyltransferase MnmC
MLSEANKYHTYARECLKLAEIATTPEIRQKLIELSRVWMEAALAEEKHNLNKAASTTDKVFGDLNEQAE